MIEDDALLRERGDRPGPLEHLEQLALGMLAEFRERVSILSPLMNHPDFNFEEPVVRGMLRALWHGSAT